MSDGELYLAAGEAEGFTIVPTSSESEDEIFLERDMLEESPTLLLLCVILPSPAS
jgi:hypothetical protein